MADEIMMELIQRMIEDSLKPINKKLEEIEAELQLMADIIGNDGDVEEKRF